MPARKKINGRPAAKAPVRKKAAAKKPTPKKTAIPTMTAKEALARARAASERNRVTQKIPVITPSAPATSSATMVLPVLRVGLGFDIHPMIPQRKLMIGGIEIPSPNGPVGHSDGDPVLHAITDALLGAAGLGDMGQHFSDTDPRWAGASSDIFLRQTLRHLGKAGFEILNLDCNVILERPKLAPFIGTIRRNIAAIMEISVERVSVKAKRHEGMDSLGRNESVAAHAVVLLVRR